MKRVSDTNLSPLGAIYEYYRVFSTLDLEAIAQWFTEPCMNLSPQGVFTAKTRGELTDAFRATTESLRSQGYVRSEYVDAQATMLTASTALVQGIAIRHGADGRVLSRVRISYVLFSTEAGWRIASMILP